MKKTNLATVIIGILFGSLFSGFGQTNIQIISIVPTPEQAMQLTWTSISNEVYEIDEADALATNSDGSTAWNTLYTQYPSQGTNTFWLDTGNYNLVPQIVHPKYMPMRFYRIVDEGSDTTSDEPGVFIGSITNTTNVSGEITITVTAFTDQPVLSGTKLYVDGQEMQMADSTTNYVVGSTNYGVDAYSLNTCEWFNGTHVLFATTECESGLGDVVDSGPIATGHGVSAFVPVTFNNLVTMISFSQPSFDPSSGQTQQVSAVFPLNSDWTLNIVDANSNVVQTATNSGMSLLYNWDGTSNGTPLPNGIYFYYITAETNGEAIPSVGGTSGGGGSGPPDPDLARVGGIGGVPTPPAFFEIPFPPLPPGLSGPLDAQGNPITNVMVPMPPALSSRLSRSSSTGRSSADVFLGGGGSFTPDGIGGPGYVTPLPDPQTSPYSPQRPPNNPVRGLIGTFGIAYDTYTGNGTNGYSLAPLDNGLHTGVHISMDGFSAGTTLSYLPVPQLKAEADNFISQMQHWGWKNSFLEADDKLNINDLRGSGSPFNNVNLGVFMSHGAYGTGGGGIDYAASGSKQMYYPITSGTAAQYLRLSEMNLGGSGTNGLKWAALFSCNSLQHNNWANMQSLGVNPYNSNLHLLLGADTTNYTSATLLWYWAKYMNYGTSANAGSYNPLTIRTAWYQAAKDAYTNSSYIPSGTTIKFIVAGDNACENDSLQTNSAPTGSWFIDPPTQVYP